ncbi:delta-aminolevulinic acid dehydratase [Thermocladium modestius]|uniref:Delta-aminolevulinic acid dehydratase n=2 Tax=Thermocladium modestius TaxID=62609 RepID=A0A830GTU8_9CREN|nr:delta-aminolevulinic acid dehydratase [Thermocladium modestius]
MLHHLLGRDITRKSKQLEGGSGRDSLNDLGPGSCNYGGIKYLFSDWPGIVMIFNGDSLHKFPSTRPRRLRLNRFLRNSVAETSLSTSNLIMPIFVTDSSSPQPINAMPGQFRWPLNEDLLKFVDELKSAGIHNVILFGVTGKKDPLASEATSKNGVVPRAIRLLKQSFGKELVIFADLCMCDYTDHGHCGVVKGSGEDYYIDNDTTLKIYGEIAVNYAEAGADVIAPSGMMDGQVKAIRDALDGDGYENVLIMSYSAKYASVFYGPFREAADSAPRFGDRRSYQMDPRNSFEALKEVAMDVGEGADIVMVKPAMPYLDVVRMVKDSFPQVPLAAYQVSGEYSMIKAAAGAGWIDEGRAVMESLTSIRRAGADLILTYFALDAARMLRNWDSLF